MINVVKELIKGQEERMAELEKGFNVERVSLAEKLMAELRESLVELGCAYLLDGNSESVDTSKLEAELARANNQINELKEKCKEIGPLKTKATKAIKAKEDMANKIKALEKELAKTTKEDKSVNVKELQEDLESANKQIEWFKSSASTWQSKYTKLFNETKDTTNTVEELNKEIDNLKEQLAQKEKEVQALQQAAISYETTKNNKIEKEVIKQVENKEESNKEYFKLNTNVKFKSSTGLYESNDHYVIAKPSVKDIVVVPKSFNVEVKKEDFVKYENLLTNEFKFDKDRQEISPVTVEFSNAKHKAYLARTEARESLYQFSYKDVLAGYIVNNYKVYSWSWNPETHKEPFIVDLGQRAKGKERCDVSPCDRKALNVTIKAMLSEYNEKVEAYAKANNLYNVTKEKAEESQNQVKNRLANLFNYDKETKAIAESAQKPQVNTEVKEDKNDAKPSVKAPQNNYSSNLNSFVNEMFC